MYSARKPKEDKKANQKGANGEEEAKAQVESVQGTKAKATEETEKGSEAKKAVASSGRNPKAKAAANAKGADDAATKGTTTQASNKKVVEEGEMTPASNKEVVEEAEDSENSTEMMDDSNKERLERDKEKTQTEVEINLEAQREIDRDDIDAELLPQDAIKNKLDSAADMSYLAGLADGWGSSSSAIKDIIVPRQNIKDNLWSVHKNLTCITNENVTDDQIDQLGNKRITKAIVNAFKKRVIPITLGPTLVRDLVKQKKSAGIVEQFFTEHMPTMGWKYKASTFHDQTGNYMPNNDLPKLKTHLILFFEEDPCLADNVTETSETLEKIRDANDKNLDQEEANSEDDEEGDTTGGTVGNKRNRDESSQDESVDSKRTRSD